MRNFYKFTFLLLFSIGVKAQAPPTATIVGLSNLFCVGVPISFSSATSSTDVAYTWSVVPAKGLSFISNLHSPTLSLTFTASTAYTVTLIVGNTNGSSSSNTILPVAKMPKASFNATLLDAGFPNQLVLTNYSSNFNSSEWHYSDVKGIDITTNTVKNYSAGGKYGVVLIAKGLRGCDDTAHYSFWISDSSGLTLPNIFSPNGDGVNDIYKPISRGIVKLNATVYNRYGAIVHSWDKVNGFWDGYTTSGLPCSMGEYFVVLEAFGFDGQKFKKKSMITLVR